MTTTRIASTIVGNARGRRRLHPNEEPTNAVFDATGHCCDGCIDGCAGQGRSSFAPTELHVAFVDGMPEGALDIEIRWDHFGKPQRLLLDSWAADALASLLRQAHMGAGVRWKVEQR